MTRAFVTVSLSVLLLAALAATSGCGSSAPPAPASVGTPTGANDAPQGDRMIKPNADPNSKPPGGPGG